jgi:hypothetical protein
MIHKILEAAGTASVCWSDKSSLGVFDPARAAELSEQLLQAYKQYKKADIGQVEYVRLGQYCMMFMGLFAGCWEHPQKGGVYDIKQAAKVAARLNEDLLPMLE